MRMVRWMYGIKIKDRVPSKELRERETGIDDIILVLQQNRLHMGMCCRKKTVIGRRNVWSMRWRAPDQEQEVDQRGLGQRLCKKIVRHIT